MKKRFFLCLLAAVSIGVASAQTKKIMHRSHSGSDSSFSIDETDDNFGISREMSERMRQRDSAATAGNAKPDTARSHGDTTRSKPGKTRPHSTQKNTRTVKK